MEDILEQGTRPKMEIFGNQLFIVLHLLSYDATNARISAEQVSIVMDDAIIFTFQETQHNAWDDLQTRKQLTNDGAQGNASERLMFALLDVIVDEYFLVVGRLAEDIEELESDVLADNAQPVLNRIYTYKRDVLFMHRTLWPLREALGRLTRNYAAGSSDASRYLAANLQHDVLQVVEAVDSLREMLTGMLDLYMSRRDLRLNEVGQVLSVVATIFIPLTFITGFYGMNFDNMPLTHWRYGYPLVVVLMLAVAFWLYFIFKRKRWFSLKNQEGEDIDKEIASREDATIKRDQQRPRK